MGLYEGFFIKSIQTLQEKTTENTRRCDENR
jgi:hypothetical protein